MCCYVRRAIAAFLCCVLLVSMAACSKASKYGQGFRFPIVGEPAQLDPQVAHDAASIEVLSSLVEGLTRLDEQGKVQSAIADSWEISTDKCTYTFHIRNNAKWSNNSVITADDFVFGWKRVLEPETHSSYGSLFQNIEGSSDADTLSVEAVNPSTLQVVLKEPDDSFLETVSKLPFAPCQKEFFNKTNGRYGMEPEDVLSSGPFELLLWSHEEYCILGKNEFYYDEKNILPSRVRYVMNYEEDEFDLLDEEGLQASHIQATQQQKAEKKDMKVISFQDTLCALWMNTQEVSFSDRQALQSALNEETIQQSIEKYHLTAAKGVITPEVKMDGQSYRTKENEVKCFAKSISISKAKTIAKSMGAYTLLCSEKESMSNIAQAMIQSWQKQLDAYLKLEVVSETELEERVQAGEYDLALYTQMPSGETVENALGDFLAGNEKNISLLNDRQFANLFQKAQQTGKRTDWEKAEQYLQKTCCCIPIAYVSRVFALGPGVDGIVIRPFNGGSGKAIYDFRKATREE